MQNSFIFYRSFFEATLPLNDTDKLVLFQAITNYALNGEETELTPISKAMFALIKPQLEANKIRYENGSKGGRPKTEPKPKANRKLTEPEPNKNLNSNSNLNENKNEREKDTHNLFDFCLKVLPEEDKEPFRFKPEEYLPTELGQEWIDRKGADHTGAMWKCWAKFFNHHLEKPPRSDWETLWINWIINEVVYDIQKNRA